MDGEARRRLNSGEKEKTIIDEIMLRFRPIAPKPVTGDTCTGSGPVGDKTLPGTYKRSKRKYVRVRKNNRTYNRRKTTRVSSIDPENQRGENGSCLKNDAVTLQLLPEKDIDGGDGKRGGTVSDLTVEDNRGPGKGLMSLINGHDQLGSDPTVVKSWVTVEHLTGACTDEETRNQLGCTDADRVKNLEKDTCPGFISDVANNVRWINGAYRTLMGLRIADQDLLSPVESRIRVCLVVKDKEQLVCMGMLNGAATCRVRLQCSSTWQEGKKQWTMIVPGDVWRMDSGEFAWRLDVEAALSLGR